MDITYYGGGCVLLGTKPLKIVIDPLSGEYGPNPKIKADVALFTQPPQAETKAVTDTTITWPGEYELQSVLIEGVAARLHTEEDVSKQDGVMYAVSYSGLRAVVLGNVHPELSDEQLDRLDGADILIAPVGGHGLTPDKESVSKLVRQFDPNFVVPVHYDDGVVNYPVPQAEVKEFLSEVGGGDVAPQSNLKVTSKEAVEQTQFVVLDPKQ